MASKAYTELSHFFAQPVCVSALSGLRAGALLRVAIGETESFTLKKEPQSTTLLESDPSQAPDLSFSLSLAALQELNATAWPELSALGIDLVKRAVSSDETQRLEIKIHVGPWELIAKGYFTVLTQAGPGFMTFLASKGLGGISKVKQAIERFRDNA